MPQLRLLPFAFVLLLVGAGCDSLSRSGEATFSGAVVDATTSEPVEGATVRAVGTPVTTTTDADGLYSLVVQADSSDQTVTITVTAAGYQPRTVEALADVRGTVEAPLVMLQRTGGTGGGTGGGGTGGTPSGPSGPGVSVSLVERTSETVGVQGAGAIETATLTFVVVDGQGRPVDAANAVDLTFSIANGPGGGESLDPLQATTDASGQAQVTLTSGTRAGTVQVLATGTVEGRTLTSRPVTITITGGLPDAAHFSLAPAQVNIAGYNRFGLTDPITAYVGDIYGNPVQPGTAVYFTTDGGLIPGSGITDATGQATATLVTAAPLPSNAVSCPVPTSPEGYARVTARTSDVNQATITTQATVLFSGITQITLNAPGPLGLGSYTYTVSDQFGHPIAPGSTLAVEIGGTNVRATGDSDYALGDYLCPGPNRTEFQFGIVQDDPMAGPSTVETITIGVTSPNGNARLTRTAGGRPGTIFDRLERF